jgi:hypothetical protein
MLSIAEKIFRIVLLIGDEPIFCEQAKCCVRERIAGAILASAGLKKNNKREKRLGGDHHVGQWRINPLFHLPYKFVA